MKTDQELADWGRQELQIRIRELEAVESAADLKAVQAAVAARRKAAGLTRNDATRAVVIAERLARGDSFEWATR